MADPERSTAVEGVPTDEDVIRIGAGCALACPFCPHSGGRAGAAPDEALAPGFPVPAAHRITILAGDCLDARFAPLVARSRAAGARAVRVYSHAGARSPGDLVALRDAGLTGVLLILPAASRERLAALTGGRGTLARAAAVIDGANALGLAVALEIPVVPSGLGELPDTVRRALNRIARPEEVQLRFLSEFDRARGPVPWDPRTARDAVSACLEEGRARHVAVRLAHPEAPPPCLLDLPGVTPETYPALGAAGHRGDGPRPFAACRDCAVASVCAADGRHLQVRAGDEPRPIPADPPTPAPLSTVDCRLSTSSTLYLRRATLETLVEEYRRHPLPCRFPWEELEAHDIRGVVTPCAGGWPLPASVDACTSWHDGGLLAAWNSPGMQAIRRAVAARAPLGTCKPECPAFHGGPQSAVPAFAPPATQPFFDNLVANLREMLDGAEVLSSRPQSISLSPTLRCPNRCSMCDIHEVRERLGNGPEMRDLTDDLYRELLDLLPTTRVLALTGGEPLVSRRVRELLREFGADRYPDGAVTLTTNGLLLREPVLRDLAATRLRMVIISLNAATEGTYEAITRTRGGFPRVLANLRRLMDAAPRMAGHPTVIASFVVMRSNFQELPAFLDLAAGLGCGVRLLPVERDRCGESIFTDEETLSRVATLVRDRVRAQVSGRPWAVRAEVARLDSILSSRLARRRFAPL